MCKSLQHVSLPAGKQDKCYVTDKIQILTILFFNSWMELAVKKGVVLCVLVEILILIMATTGHQIQNEEHVSAVAQATAKFTMDLYKEVSAKNPGENIIMSPFSISTIMAMAYAGAQGNTALQMKKGMKYPEPDILHSGYQEVLQVLKGNEDFTLNTANRLYIQKTYKILEEYNNIVMKNYLAEPKLTDFAQSEAARQEINSWVEEVTHEKIKDLIKSGVLNTLTRLVLVNAIYFKGNWNIQFDKAATTVEPFYPSDNEAEKIDVNMMHLEKKFRVGPIADLDCLALELPYKGNRLSMLILLPNQRNGLADLEKKLETFPITKIQHHLSRREVKVALPRFKLETTMELNDAMKNLEMTDMFNASLADFSGISGAKDLHVSYVVQKAFIEVNEEGSEAAAASAVVMVGFSLMISEEPVLEFFADHPFLFLIKDEQTGMQLFMGRLTKPKRT